MKCEQNAVIATTVLSRDDAPYERVRSELALQTLASTREHNYYTIVVDGGSPKSYVNKMKGSGALVLPQEKPGMGNARRQAIGEARNHAGRDGAVIWIEPEKYRMVPLLQPAVEKITSGEHDLVLFQRQSLASYPPEQALAYEIGALAFELSTGHRADYAFGPMGLSSRGVDYVTFYAGDHGDLWDSIHIPRIRMIQDGLSWTNIPIDYDNPIEQTEVEGTMDFALKRVEQVANIVNALVSELGSI